MIVIRTIVEAAKCLAFVVGLLAFGLAVTSAGLLAGRYLGLNDPISSLLAIASLLVVGSLISGYFAAKDDLHG